MILVRFLRPHSPYNPGEQAGFDEARAQHLIAQGIAQALPTATVITEPPANKALHAPPLAKQRARQ